MYLSFTSAREVLHRLCELQEKDTLWLLCVSSQHADELPAFFEAARNEKIRFCGGVFPGLINGNQRENKGIIAIPLPGEAQLACGTLTENGVEWLAPLQIQSDIKMTSALLFVDCHSPGINRFFEDIYDNYSTQVNYAGAGAGYSDLRQAHSIFCDTGFIEHGGIIILLPTRSTVNVQHGWSRVAGPFIATRTKGNIIQELNWVSAGTFYRNQVETIAPELKDRPVFPDLGSRFPLSIGKQSAEDVVRDPIEINNADEIVALSDVPENSAIYISGGNKDTLIEAAQRAVVECDGLTDINSCFISDCYSRALMLGDELETELNVVDIALKQFTDVHAEGVLALGEVCGNSRSKLEFYNKTFVITLTHR